MIKHTLIILILLSLSVVKADQVSKSVFGAGKQVSGGTYIVNGSAYQTLTGSASGTGYTMNSGYWYQNSLSSTEPTLSTQTITILGDSKAKSGGYNINDNGDAITAKGVCWNTSGTPTLLDSYTDEGTGSTSFVSYLTSLQVNQQYYVRAYATSASGTGYGNEITFIYTAIPTLPEWGLIIFGSLIAIFAVRKVLKIA